EFTLRGRSYGYIDKTGKVVIPPSFSEAGPFDGGLAGVRAWADPGVHNTTIHRVIDKTGKFVSPDYLDVEQFRGNYAVASHTDVTPRLYGVVDRELRFIIQPRYTALSPVVRQETDWDFPDYKTFVCRRADYYLSREGKTGACTVLSLDGTVVFTFPEGVEPFGSSHSDIWRARKISERSGVREWVYFDMKGNQVSYSPPKLPEIKDGYMRRVSPDRLASFTQMDDGKFNTEYWREGRWRPIGRLEMFGRLL